MPLLPFLSRFSATVPLTQNRLHQILKKAYCTARYRFGLVLAADSTGRNTLSVTRPGWQP